MVPLAVIEDRARNVPCPVGDLDAPPGLVRASGRLEGEGLVAHDDARLPLVPLGLPGVGLDDGADPVGGEVGAEELRNIVDGAELPRGRKAGGADVGHVGEGGGGSHSAPFCHGTGQRDRARAAAAVPLLAELSIGPVPSL